ncbi:hypothetical protein MHY30_07455 [Microbacterium sp. ACRRU]|uniref:hypothetical protein n=1 Tax=Microbacterium sp. ACRRU TaxID=2918204 RepID=UPI001EF4E3C3|nr:hypothetical protein [Microbacterium sp. ACRRU]MCG7417335.1 hypothetical protein [Microbacterium sp. ACRRU]
MSDLQRIGELDRHFFRELTNLRDRDGGIDDIAITPLVDAWYACLEWAGHAGLTKEQARNVAESGQEASEHYGRYTHANGREKRFELLAMRGALDVFLALFTDRESAGFEDTDLDTLRKKIERASVESEHALGVMVYVSDQIAKVEEAAKGAQTALAAAKKAAEGAETAVGLAKKAATEAATTALEEEFQTTASKNFRAAFWFRSATIFVLGIVIVLAIVFALSHAPVQGQAVDWYGITYRLAVLSGLGALAAYLGRQAGNYARLGTWAHGIQIQLKAFLGFVNEIEDGEARQTMFTLFGKRVLESPPDGKSSGDDVPTNLIQPIFEQAARLRSPQG